MVQHSSGRNAIEATTIKGDKILFHDILAKPNELTFVAKVDGTNNPGYTDKWVKKGPSIKAVGDMTVKDIQTIGGKVDLKKINTINAN
jgi:hypothetical protein